MSETPRKPTRNTGASEPAAPPARTQQPAPPRALRPRPAGGTAAHGYKPTGSGGIHVRIEVRHHAGHECPEHDPQDAAGQQLHQQRQHPAPLPVGGVHRSDPVVEQGQADQARHDQQDREHELDRGAHDIRGAGRRLARRAQGPLHDRLVSDPVGRSGDESQAQQNGRPREQGRVGRQDELEMMLRSRQLRHPPLGFFNRRLRSCQRCSSVAPQSARCRRRSR